MWKIEDLQEIDSFAIPFRDVLDILEKLEIIEADEWINLFPITFKLFIKIFLSPQN